MNVETPDYTFGSRPKSYYDHDPTRKFESKAAEARKPLRDSIFDKPNYHTFLST
jgi:hypothetical protein